MSSKRPYPFDEFGINQRPVRYVETPSPDVITNRAWHADSESYLDPGTQAMNLQIKSLTESAPSPKHASVNTSPTRDPPWKHPAPNDTDTCFGSIVDVKAAIRLRLPFIHSSNKIRSFTVLAHHGIFVLSSAPSEEGFAVLNKRTCHDLQGLLDTTSKALRFQAYITDENWNTAEKSATVRDPGTLQMDINIYGPFGCARNVGKVLSLNRTYLQQPLHGIEGLRYYNPQFFHVGDLLGENVTETPRLYCKRPVASDPKTKSIRETEIEEEDQDDMMKISNIMNSLTYNQIDMDKDIGDNRMKTRPKPHQAEAIEFIRRRETGTISQDLSLWERQTSGHDSDQKIYRHVITGDGTYSPSDPKGGVVADEMGLGKTLVILYTVVRSLAQAVQFASQAAVGNSETQSKLPSKATLVIVPSTLLMNNWIKEIRSHCNPGYLTYYKYHGEGRQLQENQQELFQKDIVLTTFATVTLDASRGQNLLGSIRWFRIVLDEAHEIRNRTTKQHQTVVSLAAGSRWCLTGTPIQNSLEDLGALVAFLKIPILESPSAFKRHIGTPSSAYTRDRFKGLEQLMNRICIHRRRGHLGLADPTPDLQLIELSDVEREEYNCICKKFRSNVNIAISREGRQTLRSTALKVLLELRLYCNNGPRENSNNKRDDDEILTELQQEDRAECAYCLSHVYSISSGSAGDTDGALLIRNCCHLICWTCMPRYHADQLRCPGCFKGDTNLTARDEPGNESNNTGLSRPTAVPRWPTKICAVVQDIMQNPHEKCIVFSAWKRTLDLIGKALASSGLPFYCIHGSLSLAQRERVILQFQMPFKSTNILLMTLGTGAVGLNLEVASRVYIMEPQWNPSISKQAIGRICRLGQTKAVSVIVYITKDTVEDRNVWPRQQKKVYLARGFDRRKKGISDKTVKGILESAGMNDDEVAVALARTEPS